MAKPKNTNGGRPKLNIDWKEFDQLCYMQCTSQEIADWFHCSIDTLERRLRAEKQVTFAVYFGKKRVGGKIALRRNLMKMSEKQPSVAIFLAKNWLGMSDRQEITGAEGEPIKTEITVLTKAAKELTEQIVKGANT